MNNPKDLFNTNPKLSTTLAFIIGLLLIDDLSADEQDMLGSWLMLISQTLVTNANSQTIIEERILNNQININSKEVKSIYNPLIYNIDKIRDIVKKIYPDQTIELDKLSKYLNHLIDKINQIK